MHKNKEENLLVCEAIGKLRELGFINHAILLIEYHTAKCPNVDGSANCRKTQKKINGMRVKLTVLYAKNTKKFYFLNGIV